MNLSIAGIGLACLVLFFLLHRKDAAPTFRLVLALVGTCLIADAAASAMGFNLLLDVVRWIEGLLSWVTLHVIGIAAGPELLLLILGFEVVWALHPKHKTGKNVGWAAIGLVLVLLVGVAQFPALNHIPGDIRQGVDNARTSIQSGGH